METAKGILLYFVPDWSCIPESLKGERDADRPRTVNIFLGFFFMVNFVLGTGFLGIPSGFFHGGLLAGVFTLLVIAVMAWLCALWEVEAMARAQALWDFRTSDQTESRSSSTSEDLASDSTERPHFHITIERKFEPSELCEVFVGRWLKIVYLIIFSIYSSLASLSYATVIGSAWSVNLPLNFATLEECSDTDYLHHILPGGGCLNSYRFCLFLFAVIVVPLSLLDLKEQAIVQLLLGLLRFFTLGAIIIYCFVYLVQGDVIANCDEGLPTPANYSSENWTDLYNSTTSIKEIVLHFNFKGWVVAIPVFVYAFILHQGIPGLTHPIKEKRLLRGYFNILFLVITIFYLTLGVLVSLWFRDCTNENCTLNWHPLTSSLHSTALRALSYYIILFPSIDVCSVFPLMIHTIVNNIYTVVFGRDTSQVKGWKHKLIQLSMKFVASILPIGIGMFVSNLVYVLKYAGLLGFFISLFFPMLFQLTSQWVCYKTFFFMLVNARVKNIAIGSSVDKPPLSVQEKKPLLGGQAQVTSSRIFFDLFFTSANKVLYMTPYSTPVLSYPLVVIGFMIIAIVCFVLTIISLFVQSTSG